MITNKELLNEYNQVGLLQRYGMAERLYNALVETEEQLEIANEMYHDLAKDNQELQTIIENQEEEFTQLKLDTTLPPLTDLEINEMKEFGCVPPQTQQETYFTRDDQSDDDLDVYWDRITTKQNAVKYQYQDQQPTDLSAFGGYVKEVKQHIQIVQTLTDKIIEEYNLPFTD